jgi:hypothetical protein
MGEAYPDRWARMRYVGDQTSDLTGLPADLRGKILRYDWNGQTHFAHAYTEQAMSQDIGIIAINPSYARAHAGMMDKIRQAHETGFFLPENVEDVLTHEFGHVWHGLTIRQAMIERITGRAATVRFTDEAIDLGGWSEFHDWVIRDWAKPRMVDYGSVYGASKPVETVAEAFVARHKGLGGEIPKLIDALEIGAQRTKGFNDIVRTSDESRLAGMELIDSILREAGIRARPQGWARTRDRLIAETERIRRIVEEA